MVTVVVSNRPQTDMKSVNPHLRQKGQTDVEDGPPRRGGGDEGPFSILTNLGVSSRTLSPLLFRLISSVGIKPRSRLTVLLLNFN